MRLLLSLLLVLIIAQAGITQVLNATVKVDIPLLKPEEKLPLQNLGSRVADFINGREWIKDPDQNIKIDINITIIVQSEYRGSEGYIFLRFFSRVVAKRIFMTNHGNSPIYPTISGITRTILFTRLSVCWIIT